MPFDFVDTNARASLRTLNSQVAAIPVRWTDDGRSEVLLITSRGGGRWTVPKGWPLTDSAANACAAREAYEEGGVLGRVESYSLGSFEYWKKDKTGRLFFQVTAYALHVDQVLNDWPERDQRKRAWFTPEVAATLTGNSQLKALIQEAARAPARTALN